MFSSENTSVCQDDEKHPSRAAVKVTRERSVMVILSLSQDLGDELLLGFVWGHLD